MDEARGKYGGREELHTGHWWRNLIESSDLKDQSIDGMIILNLVFKKWD
jgi:hypothetical protein